MHNQRLRRKRFQETAQVQPGERIDKIVLASERELNQTDFFVIIVQAIGLGIQRDSFARAHALDKLFERGAVIKVNVTRRLQRVQRIHPRFRLHHPQVVSKASLKVAPYSFCLPVLRLERFERFERFERLERLNQCSDESDNSRQSADAEQP